MATSKKILIVDDDASLRTILGDNLKEAGFVILEAQDGESGLKVAISDHPDLILLDIDMPKMGGTAMLKKLRQDDWGKKVHVIMLTNLEDTEHVAESLGGGAYDYLVKNDWKMERLVKLIKTRLGVK